MNRHPLAVMLFAAVGLASTASQTAIAGKSTTRHVTATATILPAFTNDQTDLKSIKTIEKFISNDGRVSKQRAANSRPIIIIDLP